MKNFSQSLLDLWKQLGLNQRVSLMVAALAVIGGLIAVVLWSRRPDYQLLYARLSEKDAAAIIGQLQTQNIPLQVTAGGTAVQVPSDQVYKLRMDLAAKGLPSGDGVGFEGGCEMGGLGLAYEGKQEREPCGIHLRHAGEIDKFHWYCQSCGNFLHEETFVVADYRADPVSQAYKRFFDNEDARTCKKCGTVMPNALAQAAKKS